MRFFLFWLLTTLLCVVSITDGVSQTIDVKKKTEKKATQRANKKVDKTLDKGFDALEDGIDGIFKKKKKKSEGEDGPATETESKDSNETDKDEKPENTKDHPEQIVPQSKLVWSQFDFVPGTDILFEDNQENEQNGEFPGKWDLVAGTIENAVFGEANVLYIRETGNFPNGIVPLIKNAGEDYLPDEFTVEFDAFFEKDVFGANYRVYFYDAKKQKKLAYFYVDFLINNASFGSKGIQKQFPNTERTNIDKVAKWRHISISFNKRALKVYMDDMRMLNIPNIEENPTGITIGVNHGKTTDNQFIKNIRIAKGAVPLYDKFLTDGKFVTTGIKFDVNKATIKPESTGTINYVAQMLKDHPDLKFSVEGHTDSDGETVFNQKLSEERAFAVVNALTSLGISSDRLTARGFGETKPMEDNATSEGKAQNRRVEFVKQ